MSDARGALSRASQRRGVRRLFARVALAGVAFGTACGGGGHGRVVLDPLVLVPDTIDVAPDADAAAQSVEVVDRDFPPTDCAVLEGSTQAGMRRLLRFDTVVVNHGELPVVLGDPANPQPPFVPGDFTFAPCHQHYHFDGWALYRLLDQFGNVAATGHKQAFCLLDTDQVVPQRMSFGYDCDHQGISPGWADIYDRNTDGQWVDITGVPQGDYRLEITVDAAGKVPQANNRWPDTVTVDVHVPDPNLPP